MMLGVVRHCKNPCLRNRCMALYETAHKSIWFSTDGSSASSPLSSPGSEGTVKRTRRRFRRIEEVPSYRDFLHRQSVFALYRQFLRTVRPLPDHQELRDQIKKEFNAMKQETDPWNQKRAVKEGQRRLKDLQTTVSTSVTFGPTSPPQAGQDDNDEEPKVGSGWPWQRN